MGDEAVKLKGLGRSVLSVAGLSVVCAGAWATDFTLTTDADFDTGSLNGVNHDNPNNDQLQLNTQGTTFPLLWIANGGEDTLSKVDVNGGPDGEGCETARYMTGFGPTSAQAGYVNHFNNPFSGLPHRRVRPWMVTATCTSRTVDSVVLAVS